MKILFTDLDGTLLADDKSVPEKNYAAIEAMRAAGHKIVLCSGRPTISVLAIAKRLSLNVEGCYVIGFNGAQIADAKTGECVFRTGFEATFVKEIFEKAHAAGLHIQAFDDEKVVVERETEALAHYCRTIQMQYVLTDDVEAYFRGIGLTSSKMLVIDLHDHEALEAFRVKMLSEYEGKIDMLFSNPWYLETINKGISKGAAVEKLCDILNVPIADSVGAGDEMNDLPLLEAAHVGCALVNGNEAVKARADYVTTLDNNEGGLAEIIERFILQEAH